MRKTVIAKILTYLLIGVYITKALRYEDNRDKNILHPTP